MEICVFAGLRTHLRAARPGPARLPLLAPPAWWVEVGTPGECRLPVGRGDRGSNRLQEWEVSKIRLFGKTPLLPEPQRLGTEIGVREPRDRLTTPLAECVQVARGAGKSSRAVSGSNRREGRTLPTQSGFLSPSSPASVITCCLICPCPQVLL